MNFGVICSSQTVNASKFLSRHIKMLRNSDPSTVAAITDRGSTVLTSAGTVQYDPNWIVIPSTRQALAARLQPVGGIAGYSATFNTPCFVPEHLSAFTPLA